MSTVEPIPPKPKWARRWLRQGAVLCLRSGEGAAFFVLGMMTIGTLAYALDTALVAALGRRSHLLDDFIKITTCAAAVPLLLSITAFLAKADRGTSIEWAHIRTLSPTIIIQAIFWLGIISLIFGGVFGGWRSDLTTSFADAQAGPWFADNTHPLMAILGAGIRGATNGLIVQVFHSTIAYAFVIGMSASWQSASLFDTRMMSVIPKVRNRLFLILLGFSIFVSMFGIAGAALIYLYLAWSYVGAREIAGGIGENGKVESRTPTAVPNPT